MNFSLGYGEGVSGCSGGGGTVLIAEAAVALFCLFIEQKRLQNAC